MHCLNIILSPAHLWKISLVDYLGSKGHVEGLLVLVRAPGGGGFDPPRPALENDW